MARFGLRDRLRPASGKRSAPRPSRNSWGRRLVLESLEQRVVLSTVIWDGGGGDSNWNNPRNWDNDLLPGPDDDVYIDISALGPSTVTLSSGNVAIKSLQSGKALAISGGTFSVSTTADINNNLTLSNGILTGSGVVTVSGTTTWTGGTMSGSGSTNALGGLAIARTNVQHYLKGRTLNNAGAATLATQSPGYGLYVSDGGTINNLAGASFAFIADAHIQDGGGTPRGGTFNNLGTLAKTGGIGSSLVSIALNNAGLVQAASGTLNLTGGGAFGDDSATTIAEGATLQFGNGTFAIPAGSSISGAGSVLFSGGTVNIAGTFDVAGGTAITGGTAAFNAAASTASLTQSGGTLSGSSILTVTGLTTWTGGEMTGSGVTNALGGLAIGSSGGYDVNLRERTLNNADEATLVARSASYGLYVYNGGTFNNLPGASFDFISDARIVPSTGGTFNNQGTLSKTGGSGTSTIGIALNNAGLIQAESGTLSLSGGGAFGDDSATTIAEGATLQFGNGTFAIPAGSSISGAGSVLFSGNSTVSTTIAGTYDVAGGTRITGGTAISPDRLLRSVVLRPSPAGR